MDKEWLFLLMPLNATTWWAGGKYNKLCRLLGFMLCLAVCAWMAHMVWWKACLLTMTSFTARLPFTLMGKAIDASWLNWAWIWVLSAIHILPCFIIRFNTAILLLAIYCAIMNAMLETASNVVFSKDSFPWAMCAIFSGVFIMAPYCLATY